MPHAGQMCQEGIWRSWISEASNSYWVKTHSCLSSLFNLVPLPEVSFSISTYQVISLSLNTLFKSSSQYSFIPPPHPIEFCHCLCCNPSNSYLLYMFSRWWKLKNQCECLFHLLSISLGQAVEFAPSNCSINIH